jgi:hypothetical protein
MKVLHIITRMNTGGPAVFLDHLTNAISKLGCESVIAYGFCESNEADYTDNHKLNAKLVKIKSLHRSLNPLDDIRTFFQIRKVIRQVKPDLVNTHTSKGGVLGLDNFRQRALNPAADALGWRMEEQTDAFGRKRAMRRFTLHSLRDRYGTTAADEWGYSERQLLQQGSWADAETVRKFYLGTTDETLETVDLLRAKFPNLLDPPSDDICYATQNRQKAVKEISLSCDVMLVVGSANSSNTVRLVDVALEAGARAAYRVDFAGEIDEAWMAGVETVGLTSGASVPEILVESVLTWLAERGYTDVEEVETIEEHLIFALPPELRRDIKAAGRA